MSHIAEGELTAYADGAYAPEDADAQRIAAHLATCANCRNRLAEEKALSGRATEILSFAVPQSIEMPAFETLAASTKPKRAPFPLAWAATVILALGLGWFGHGELQQVNDRERVASTPATPVTKAIDVTSEKKPLEAPASAANTASAPPAVAVATPPSRHAAPDRSTAARGAAVGTVAETQRADAGAATSNMPAAEPAAKSVTAQVAGTRAMDAAAPAAPPPATLPMHAVPELVVVNSQYDGARFIVQQRLPDSKLITVTTQYATANLQEAESNKLDAKVAQRRAALASDTVARVVRNGFTITVSGPLSLDSLLALAKKVK